MSWSAVCRKHSQLSLSVSFTYLSDADVFKFFVHGFRRLSCYQCQGWMPVFSEVSPMSVYTGIDSACGTAQHATKKYFTLFRSNWLLLFLLQMTQCFAFWWQRAKLNVVISLHFLYSYLERRWAKWSEVPVESFFTQSYGKPKQCIV